MKIPRIVYVAVFAFFTCCVFALPGYAQVTETYCSTDVPLLIPPVGTSGTTTSILNVSNTGNEIIQDVKVQLQINHTWQGDLDVTLISPVGTPVILFEDVDGSNDNFGTECQPMPNFTLDDDAATPVSSINASDPVGSFIPENPLSTFAGENQSGLWTPLNS